jgi:flagellar biosynthesis/type III secretory pathway M-ring protein FliF/YscJ
MNAWQSKAEWAIRWYQTRPAFQRWLVAGCLVCAALFTVASRLELFAGSPVPLFEGRELSADEIGAMQIAFGKSGLNEYRIAGPEILVPPLKRASYLKSLADHGAVPDGLAPRSGSDNGFEFLQSRSQQRQASLDRKKQSIRELIQQLAFVQRASVEYDETAGSEPFGGTRRTAVVTVQPVKGELLDDTRIKAVRDTVCGAVAGMNASDVTIVDLESGRSWSGNSMPVRSGVMQAHVSARMFEEQQYTTKIREALAAYPGVRVNVEVAVDPVVRRIRDERTVDPETVPSVRTVQNETVRRNPGTGSSVAPGAFFNAGANGQARIAEVFPEVLSQLQTERTETVSGSTFESVETSGLTVSAVSVSIGLPETCIRHFAGRISAADDGIRIPGESPEACCDDKRLQQVFEQVRDDVLQKIEPLVSGITDTENRKSRIVVTIDPEIPTGQSTFRIEKSDAVTWRPDAIHVLTASFVLVAMVWAFRLRKRG